MAFTDSIKWNGKSIRDLFAEITHVKGRGKPPVDVKSAAVPGRHGRIALKQTYRPRIIEIAGTIEGVSHATLMSNIENLKSLFAMQDEMLSPGEESITDGFKYGKLEFGDESDRHYNAVFDGIFELQDISHQWMRNEIKLIRVRFRCDEPFAISNSLTEATMAGKADEFKVFSTGNAQSKPIIELNGAVTNPMLIEGDKVGVAHFDYNDNLSDVTLSTVAGNFSNKFGYRSIKSLTSQQSKAIQINGIDNLYYDRGSLINGKNYTNFNPYQGTIALWVRPNFDGNDGYDHELFRTTDNGNNQIRIQKSSGSTLRASVKLGGTDRAPAISGLSSSNWAKGTWYFVVTRWDLNNTIDSSSNYVQIDLVNSTEEAGISSALVAPTGQDEILAIGQSYSTTPNGRSGNFDGLIHYHICERALTDAEVTALYNSGAGVEPLVTPDTKLLSAGELDGSNLPVSVQYPWVDNKFAAGNQETNPAGEWVSTNIDVTNESTIVKYDTQSAQLDWLGDPSGSFAQNSTVALVDNDDYFYRFWIYVGTLNASDELHLDIVGSTQVHTRRLDTGTDDMGVAYATGKWLYFEGVFQADGAAAHEFRIRKVNTNGDATVYIDQMDCQVNPLSSVSFPFVNGAMGGTYHSGTGAEVPESWATLNATKFTGSKETSDTKGGGDAWKAVVTSPGGGIDFKSTYTSGKWYLISWWGKVTAGAISRWGLDTLRAGSNATFEGVQALFNADIIAGNDWNKYTLLVKCTLTDTKELVFSGASGCTMLIDNVSIIELDTVSANASSQATTEIDSYSQEKFGQGLRLDGGDTLSWSITGNKNEGSVVCWLKPQFGATWADETDEPVLFELYNDANNYLRLSYDWTNDKFIFRKRVGGVDYDAEAGNQTFENGEMLSVIGTYGSNGVRIYANGVLGGVINSNSAPLTGNPGTLYLSNKTQTQFPDAIIDEIYLFSRELAAAEALKYSNQNKPVKNNNAKISLTKTLSDGDKLLIDSEKETIEFADSSANSFTNAIASMDSGSYFPNLDSNESVLFNKVANAGIKLNYNKKWL